MSVLPIGTMCVWYQNADLNYRPIPGVVVGIENETLELELIASKSSTMTYKRNVHHVSHQAIEDSADIRRDYGAWDTIQSAEDRRVARIDEAAALKIRVDKNRQDANRELEKKSKHDLIVKMSAEKNMDAVEIAEKLGFPWNHQRVTAVLKKSGKQVAV